MNLAITPLKFDSSAPTAALDIPLARENWPCIYILNSTKTKQVYVGETARLPTRMQQHLQDFNKASFAQAYVLTSPQLNKSATLHLEAALINLFHADELLNVTNANAGQEIHPYYQRNTVYDPLVGSAWDKLIGVGLAQTAREELENSDLFKLSPFKSLTATQERAVIQLLRQLQVPGPVLVQGGAGTGKSVIAIYLCKLLSTPDARLDPTNLMHKLALEWRNKNPNAKIGMVVAMTSFRATLQRVFKSVSGLNKNMVLAPSDLAKSKYDLVLVDEAHRLSRRKAIVNYASFDSAARALGRDPANTDHLEWVLLQSKASVLFYDPSQSVKPADVPASVFKSRLAGASEIKIREQLRSKGGTAWAEYLDDLFNPECSITPFESNDFRSELFESYADLVSSVEQRESAHGLCRLVAGYAWPWASKSNPKAFDIEIDGIAKRWNSVAQRWVESDNSINEIGCIHTTQGYDLNYVGVIIGNDLHFDPVKNCLLAEPKSYFDRNGGVGLSADDLLEFLINIYKTLMLRGIRGVGLYVCNPELHAFLSQRMHLVTRKTLVAPQVSPERSREFNVPVYDLAAAAGTFGEPVEGFLQGYVQAELVPQEAFVCKINGTSMNRLIDNGEFGVFRPDTGGSRQGKFVLVEWLSDDLPNGEGRYTFKRYERELKAGSIRLLPYSTDPNHEPIVLNGEAEGSFRVVGIWVRKL